MRQTNDYSNFFRLTVKLIKYFLLAVFSFVLVAGLSVLLDMPAIAQFLIEHLAEWILKAGIVVMGMLAIAVVTESLR